MCCQATPATYMNTFHTYQLVLPGFTYITTANSDQSNTEHSIR